MNGDTPTLRIDNLTVAYRQGDDWLEAVRGVNLTIEAGQSYGLVGESGSGKSTLALAIMGYLGENGAIRAGQIVLAGRDITGLTPAERQAMWRSQVKLVPQNPLASLNPSLRIGEQLAEGLPPNGGKSPQARVEALLEMVHLADPRRVARSYPHQLSGGMQQRVMIALALASEPALLVLDEPTTNLDVTTEAVILDLLAELIKDRATAVLLVSHNLNVVAQFCDRVAVLYAGELVEDAPVAQLYQQPLHPYTQGLLDSLPRLGQTRRQTRLAPIPGAIPRLLHLPPGCVFEPRCPLAIADCRQRRPELEVPAAGRQVRCLRWPELAAHTVSASTATPEAVLSEVTPPAEAEPVLNVIDLKKEFAAGRSLGQLLRGVQPPPVRAVDGITLRAGRGQTLGIVGESGSGKSTLARCIIGLIERSSGEVSLLDLPLARQLSRRDQSTLRQLQMVFQNPEEALNPYHTVGEVLRRTLTHLAGYSRAEADVGVRRLLAAVKLDPDYIDRRPTQLSGGEKQRVAIARAFASQPNLLLFDEAVSALDVSVQASILNLLNELQQEQQSAYLFISHDLAVVSYLADEIAVVYLGHLMEVGRTADVLRPPYHPYTEALLSAIPLAYGGAQAPHVRLAGDIPSPSAIPTGCRFHSRCPRFLGDICRTQEPPWQDAGQGHRIYCHIPPAELAEMQQNQFDLRFTNDDLRVKNTPDL
jgi:peptide/nickel transport system ATP-binding protein